MALKLILTQLFLYAILTSFAQNNRGIKFGKISCAEKLWVVTHPFVAKKARKISIEARKITAEVKKSEELNGEGNGDQIDAFRHTYWMARLAQEIGTEKAKSLGIAHEKGNYRTYKRRRKEDGVIPDKISSEMDLFNNNVGLVIGEKTTTNDLKNIIVQAILEGQCKIIWTDKSGNCLNCRGSILLKEELTGKWKNDKCLVDSDK